MVISSFSYWDNADRHQLHKFSEAWARILPNHRIIGPEDAAGLIASYFGDSPRYLDAFVSMRIPAARSDIARYLALYRFGGLYMDVHFGYHDPSAVQGFLASTAAYDATLINVVASMSPRMATQIRVINGLIVCKPEHPLLLAAAKTALENVSLKKEQEKKAGYEPYNIFSMTGPGLLNEIFFTDAFRQGSVKIPQLKAGARATRIENEENVPIRRNLFKASYSLPGTHWSERQRRERLFGSES
jgi:mannosyltransferase OCH1-like enzyme